MSIPQWFPEDASCGPTNPTHGLMKQFTQDKSLQQDRFSTEQYGEGSSKGAFRTQTNIKRNEDNYVQKFFQHPGQEFSHPPDLYNLDQMSKEIEAIRHDSQRNGDWAADFLNQSKSTARHIVPDNITVHPEFEEFNTAYKNIQNRNHQNKWAAEFSQFQHLQTSNIEIHPEEVTAFEQAFEDAKKSASWESEFKAQEQSWVNEFKQQEESTNGNDSKTELASVAGRLVASIEGETNPKFKDSSFLKFMKKLSNQELSIEGNKIVEQKTPISNWSSEFNKQENNNINWGLEFNKQQNNNNNWGLEFNKQQNNSINWGSEFNKQQNNNRNWGSEFNKQQNNGWSTEFLNKQTNSSSNLSQEFYEISDIPKNGESSTSKVSSSSSDWATEFQKTENDWIEDFYKEKYADKNMKDLQNDWKEYNATSTGYSFNNDNYVFYPNNPYLSNPNLLSEVSMKGQNLAESVLFLEAKVQLDPNDSYSWYQLGTRQQENEQEPKAIAALRKAASLNPQILDSWLSLAVSYTNEYRRDDVYDVLESWFEHNSKYKQLLEQQRGKRNFAERHEFFTDLFIKAALLNPGENLDPDVQIGLGILYNVSEEYNKAKDCFQSALSLRPNDYLLWNKLGATMANAREPEKAANAYFNALEINPLYVRARYNLAISFINMKEYREAVEHLLAALALQVGDDNTNTNNKSRSFHSVSEGVMSSNIWDTLKTCCGFLNRPDLESRCDIKDLNSFKKEFEF